MNRVRSGPTVPAAVRPIVHRVAGLVVTALVGGLMAGLTGGLLGGLLGACGRPGDDRLLVAAASSLRAALPEVLAGQEVDLSFAGSQALAAQVRAGSPLDLVVTADRHTMETLVDEGLILGSPAVVARNRLAIIVPSGNPAGIGDLADLADPAGDRRVVMAAPEVPAGRYTRQALARAGVTVTPASLEASVGGVVAKVALGEADAGVAYVTDAVASGGKVAAIPIAAAPPAEYLAGVPVTADDAARGRQLLARLRAAEAQAILTRFGFQPAERPTTTARR